MRQVMSHHSDSGGFPDVFIIRRCWTYQPSMELPAMFDQKRSQEDQTAPSENTRLLDA